MPTKAKRNARILILSNHPLLAALLGMLVELESFEPAFADPEESAEDALARIKPLLVVLLDADMKAAQSDLFFARAARRGVRVVLFKPPGSARDVRALAEARSLDWISLPIDRRTLAGIIGPEAMVPRRSGDRRSDATPSVAPDGALMFRDRAGREWLVYDRRGGPRRAANRSRESPPGSPLALESYRAFISESGEEWRFPFRPDEPLLVTEAALERQLAQAILHVPEPS